MRHTMRFRRFGRGLVASLTALLALTVTPAVSAADGVRVCRDADLPVALRPGMPRTEHLHGVLCEPAGRESESVQLLVHGITYDGGYWSFPDPAGGSSRYDYTAHATQAGFATFAVDRLGSGGSSHPLSAAVMLDSNAYTLHQAIGALRSGATGHAYRHVVYVGHSYGTLVGWAEVGKYHDVDAAVFTGASHELTVTGPLLAVPSLRPAATDPKFAGQRLDPGYVTTVPGTRGSLFYAPAPYDPAVVAYDEKTKQTMTAGEVIGFVQALTSHYDIRVPTLLVDGTDDALFCRENTGAFPAGTPGIGDPAGASLDSLLRTAGKATGPLPLAGPDGANCDTPQSLIAEERPYLGARIPQLDAFLLPAAGHDLNQAFDAETYFDVVQRWTSQHLG